MARDIDSIKRALRDQGWRIEPRGKHEMAYPPDKNKPAVLLPTSPGGGRWKQNLIAQLRRSGFVWPHSRKES